MEVGHDKLWWYWWWWSRRLVTKKIARLMMMMMRRRRRRRRSGRKKRGLPENISTNSYIPPTGTIGPPFLRYQPPESH
jgi:hypothetical protein